MVSFGCFGGRRFLLTPFFIASGGLVLGVVCFDAKLRWLKLSIKKAKEEEDRVQDSWVVSYRAAWDNRFGISLNQYMLALWRIISFSRFQKTGQLKLTVLMSAFLNRQSCIWRRALQVLVPSSPVRHGLLVSTLESWFRTCAPSNFKYKIPHLSWNRLYETEQTIYWLYLAT